MDSVLPGGHTQSDRNVLPGRDVFFDGQAMQVASLTAAIVEEYVPASHNVHLSKPRDALKRQPAQASHDGCPRMLM